MADRELLASLAPLADPDSQIDIKTAPNTALHTQTTRVLNTHTDSAHVTVNRDEEELLKYVLTDSYCHVCHAVLAQESQRYSHYEGKKHAVKLRAYLQTVRRQRGATDDLRRRLMSTDPERFCELCNMLFSSAVVAKSHYAGKVHSKNLRKQGLYLHTAQSSSSPTQKPAPEENPPLPPIAEPVPGPPTSPGLPEVDLSDPNRYCSLCCASFNNRQMALQHYNGRKHMRNRDKQELLKELGDEGGTAELMCEICRTEFDSVEMFQAHVQGNKHHNKEQKVLEVCRSQQKVYSSFSDELQDYIKVQRTRGVTPKTTVPLMDTHQGSEEDPVPPHYPPVPGYYPPRAPWAPPGRDWGPPFMGRPKKRRHRRDSSSASSSSSSSGSSSESSSSDSKNSRYRERRQRRSAKRVRGRHREERKHRGRKNGAEKQKHRKVASEEEELREEEHKNKMEDKNKMAAVEEVMEGRSKMAVEAEVEMMEEDLNKQKMRTKERKRLKKAVDTRTEEERLWDDSILGF